MRERRKMNEQGGVAANVESSPVSVSVSVSTDDYSDPPPPPPPPRRRLAIPVSKFDYSVENHFRAVDTISKLCGDPEFHDLDKFEIERLSSSITFLREWRHFHYPPRMVRFACESDSSQRNGAIGGVNLPQFSAATVPKKERQDGNAISPECSKDFVMYAGGSVWALDWCPRAHQISDCRIKSEFLAVAAHPPESSYHKMGAPLTGRGVIQVWCVLNVSTKEEDVPPRGEKKLKQNPKNIQKSKVNSDQPKKPRGRPKKNPVNESVDNLDCSNQCVQALSVQFPEDSWCVLNVSTKEEDVPPRGEKKLKQNPKNIQKSKVNSDQPMKPRGRPKKNPVNESVDNLDRSNQCVQALSVQFPEDSSKLRSDTIKVKSDQPKKPRGRPRKKPINEAVDNIECSDQYGQALSLQVPEDSSKLLLIDGVPMGTDKHGAKKGSGRKRKGSIQGEYADNSTSTASMHKGRLKVKARKVSHNAGNDLLALTQNENQELPCGSDPVGSSGNGSKTGSLETSPATCPIPKDVALPRIVLCLAHDGKVAWDVKWRPSEVCGAKSNHRMGYLAVLLGNGALEVWEVPFPRAIKTIYSACQRDGTDPRFLKLEPVFRCSKLQCGNRQSIPLTVEWSSSPPHDFILAGCHDGMVALWKFSANCSSKDTRPLLCFSADTVPIRALAWAPIESDNESANVIVTVGHRGGFKFWDIRDPFRPLWELTIVQRIIYSLDWLPDPRCIVISFDDGTLRILSLTRAANDAPVTAKPYVGTQQQGLNNYMPLKDYAIWSVQVSRQTGMVAYCTADGTVFRFQLTTKEVEKGDTRNRYPHYLCGSLTEEESALIVFTPLPDIPFPMQKAPGEWCNAPRTIRGFLSASNKARRAKEGMVKDQTSDDQTLALCYGGDPRSGFELEDTVVSQRSKSTPKSKMSSKKKTKADQALVCRNEEPEKVQREESDEGKVGNGIESFPPKSIAMHRVRWNMNKGSERWLCYGGAAGIVRCQEI